MNQQTIDIVQNWAQDNPDFLANFFGMANEYKNIVEESGINFDSDKLTLTRKCFEQVTDLLQTAGVA